MTNELNFKTRKKVLFTLTLDDENETTIKISAPSKELMDEIVSAQQDIKTERISKEDSIDALYELSAKIMNNNVSGVTMTKEKLTKLLDYGEIATFFKCFTNFIESLADSKN